MAIPYLTAIDLGKNELQNARVQNLSSDPGTPVAGQIYYNSTNHVFEFYNGTAFIVLGTLDQITKAAADVDINTHKLINVVDPTGAQDAATKNYVDSVLNGLAWKTRVRAATTVNGTLATAYANSQVIDGVTLVTGDRILLKNQTTQTDNGIYIVAASGAPTRSTDADSGTELVNAAVFVAEGTTLADTAWVQTANAPITIGSTNIVFVQFGAGTSYTGSTGIALVGNDFRIENSGVLTVAHGGWNLATLTAHAVYVGNGTSAPNAVSVGATGTVLRGQTGADPIFGAVVLTTDVTGVLPIANGGTNASSTGAAKTSLGFMTRFAADIGDGSTTAIAVTHGLSTLDTIAQVVRKSDGVVVECDVANTSTTVTTFTFATAPTTNQYRVTIIG